MFSSILGKKEETSDSDSKYEEVFQKISKMNLTEMRSYVNNKIKDFEVTKEGLLAVMKRLVMEDENTSKRYIKDDDMDSKIKKAFELVLIVSTNKKICIAAIELIQQFTEVYADIIAKYDQEHKQIYSSRFKDSIENAVNLVGEVTKIERKMGVLR